MSGTSGSAPMRAARVTPAAVLPTAPSFTNAATMAAFCVVNADQVAFVSLSRRNSELLRSVGAAPSFDFLTALAAFDRGALRGRELRGLLRLFDCCLFLPCHDVLLDAL